MSCYIERTNLIQAIQQLKQSSYTILASALDKTARPIQAFLPQQKVALIIGNEGAGICEEVCTLADEKIYIPIQKTQSLNAGIAAGILMYHFAR